MTRLSFHNDIRSGVNQAFHDCVSTNSKFNFGEKGPQIAVRFPAC